MENLIYWQGVAVGLEVCGRIQWFTGAPAEAVAALTATQWPTLGGVE